jgi:2-amino-4-hydroxy-6-hydroxymethyldihydropteridine diphosphokinase
MITAYVGIGSNIDKRRHVELAVKALQKLDSTLRFSTIYESPALGFSGDSFFNLIVEMKTSLTLKAFFQQLREIENQLGRSENAQKLQDRTIDLDIILFGELVNDSAPKVPREDIYKYPFVIQPLYELCPELVIPDDGRTVSQIWQQAESLPLLSQVDLWF